MLICVLLYVILYLILFFFFFSSRRRHTRFDCDWSSDVCSSDLHPDAAPQVERSERLAAMIEQVEVGDLPERRRRRRQARQDGASERPREAKDRKSTRLNSSHSQISYAVFCLKKKRQEELRASAQ